MPRPPRLQAHGATYHVTTRGNRKQEIFVDTREKYPFRFAGRDLTTERIGLPVGDYGVRSGDHWVCIVERKSVADLIGSLANGTLAFQLAHVSRGPTGPTCIGVFSSSTK